MVNHYILEEFIKILYQSSPHSGAFTNFLHALAYIYPCVICRRLLIDYIKKTTYKKVVNRNINKKFVDGYLAMIQSHRISPEEHLLLLEQKYQINPELYQGPIISRSAIQRYQRNKNKPDMSEYSKKDLRKYKAVNQKIKLIQKLNMQQEKILLVLPNY